ncbi:MAG: hypothetical protein J6Y20_08985 [Lachnospiraceae bacterium]|nr:hypothetical protein [Lachnospiraceae bacterium]
MVNLLRRREMAQAGGSSPSGPPYPFPVIEDGPLAGTGGQRVVYNNTASRYTGVYHNKVGTSTSPFSGDEVFSIPAGASYVLTAEINSVVSGMGLARAGFFVAKMMSLQPIALTTQGGDVITEPGTYTVTGVAASDFPIGEFGFRTSAVSKVCEVDMTITLTVNGVRYI